MSREEEQSENDSAAVEADVADAAAFDEGGTQDVADAGSAESQNDPDELADAADVDDDNDDDDDDDDDDDEDVVIYDADAEDAAEKLAAMRRAAVKTDEGGAVENSDDIAPGGSRSMSELISIIESLIFVSEEPLPAKTLADVLKEDRGWVQVAVEDLAKEFNERNGGLMLREVAGGWQFATRPENHEHVRAYLKSRPSAKLSLAALETLAVIAYKQPITVPEILEIRGVQSSSAIKTLLDKRLIISKGRKETVGRPMLYGTSKEFLLQFGLRDLSELPNVEDFEDLATGGA